MNYQHEIKEKTVRYDSVRPGYPARDSDLWGRMEGYLRARWLSFDVAKANGWYPARYRGAARIVIPCSNSANVPYFQARDMDGKAKLRYASPPANRDDSVVLVWPTKRPKGSVIVEGPMCALASAELGYLGIAVMGNNPTHEVLEYIAAHAKPFQPAIVVPDIDALDFGPGVLCPLTQAGLSGMIKLPQKKDIADMPPEARRDFLWL